MVVTKQQSSIHNHDIRLKSLKYVRAIPMFVREDAKVVGICMGTCYHSIYSNNANNINNIETQTATTTTTSRTKQQKKNSKEPVEQILVTAVIPREFPAAAASPTKSPQHVEP